MAYGVGTPANDWTQEVSNNTETKVLHSSMSNPLSNHGDYCRRFNPPNVDKVRTVYQLIDSNFQAVGNKSERIFFQCERTNSASLDGKQNVNPFVGINTPTNSDDGYIAMFSGTTGSNYGVFLGVSGVKDATGNGWPPYLNTTIAYANIDNGTDANGKWYGMRMDITKEDTDAHIKIYIVEGSVDCSDLDANGEPDWGVPIIDIIHQLGNATPVVIAGTLYNSGSKFLVDPLFDGKMFWGVVTGNNSTSHRTFIDTISCRKIDA